MEDRDGFGKADAHLIATAPELLAFCEEILQSWWDVVNTSTIEPTERMRRLEALIRKAKGESNAST